MAANNPVLTNGVDLPLFIWPNLEAGASLKSISVLSGTSIAATIKNIPAKATRLLALVDSGNLSGAVRVWKDVTAGTSTTAMTIGVPGVGLYRVRVVRWHSKIGLYVDGTWLLDYNGNGVWDGPSIDKQIYFGGPGYTPYVGDWNGSGTSKIAVYRDGTRLIDSNGNLAWDDPVADRSIYFGGPGYTPVLGDWNGSGTTKLGVHLNGTWLLDFNGNFTWDGLATDKLLYFGGPGSTPVVGDWNGSGTTKVGACLNGWWVLDYNGSFAWEGTTIDRLIFFGGPGYTPIVGDWNGSGTAKVAPYRGRPVGAGCEREFHLESSRG